MDTTNLLCATILLTLAACGGSAPDFPPLVGTEHPDSGRQVPEAGQAEPSTGECGPGYTCKSGYVCITDTVNPFCTPAGQWQMACMPDGSCQPGLECSDRNVCVTPQTADPEAGTDPTGDAAIEAAATATSDADAADAGEWPQFNCYGATVAPSADVPWTYAIAGGQATVTLNGTLAPAWAGYDNPAPCPEVPYVDAGSCCQVSVAWDDAEWQFSFNPAVGDGGTVTINSHAGGYSPSCTP